MLFRSIIFNAISGRICKRIVERQRIGGYIVFKKCPCERLESVIRKADLPVVAKRRYDGNHEKHGKKNLVFFHSASTESGLFIAMLSKC